MLLWEAICTHWTPLPPPLPCFLWCFLARTGATALANSTCVPVVGDPETPDALMGTLAMAPRASAMVSVLIMAAAPIGSSLLPANGRSVRAAPTRARAECLISAVRTMFDWQSFPCLLDADRMPWTIAELAEQLYVDPGNIETVVAIYPDDPEDMWSEEGALPDLMCDALEPVFNPHAERSNPPSTPRRSVRSDGGSCTSGSEDGRRSGCCACPPRPTSRQSLCCAR